VSSFNAGLFLEKRARRVWRTTRPISYSVGQLGSGWTITVPEGFETDGASIPRLLWILWPPFGGDYDQAAVLHDYLYRTAFKCMERVVADAIFIEAMQVCGTGPWTRWPIFLGVRAGGWVTYRRYRRQAGDLPAPKT